MTPHAGLPNLFQFNDGSLLVSPEDWQSRRRELFEAIVELEYGGLPPAPASCTAEELHTCTGQQGRFATWRVVTGPTPRFSFLMTTRIPPGDGPFPVVLTGDACWRFATDEVMATFLSHGYVVAQFNRVEIAPDIIRDSSRSSGLYQACPEGHYGALAAWAWGYHRCVDALRGMSFVDPNQIAITGHSRGGKTVLLAGATDERIALVAANNSGAGGAGCFRIQAPGSETLADLLRNFPYWFGPDLRAYIGNENTLPFDQHFLKALVAPRCLLTTEALGDLWANPAGTWQTHITARKAYEFLNAGHKIGIHYREGEHDHSLADWKVFLDFMEWQFRNKTPSHSFDRNPF